MANPTNDSSVPKSFISYSWDNDEHREWVRQIAIRLRENGVDVTLDRWHCAPGDQIAHFMEKAVSENEFVIAICTPNFGAKSDRRDGGVGYENNLMTAYTLATGYDKQFIPVLRSGIWNEVAPKWLLGRYKIDLRGDKYSEMEYEELLRTLHNAREKAPPIGSRPNFEGMNAFRTGQTQTSGISNAGSHILNEQSLITPLKNYVDMLEVAGSSTGHWQRMVGTDLSDAEARFIILLLCSAIVTGNTDERELRRLAGDLCKSSSTYALDYWVRCLRSEATLPLLKEFALEGLAVNARNATRSQENYAPLGEIFLNGPESLRAKAIETLIRLALHGHERKRPLVVRFMESLMVKTTDPKVRGRMKEALCASEDTANFSEPPSQHSDAGSQP